jgi:hypothetical protein
MHIAYGVSAVGTWAGYLVYEGGIPNCGTTLNSANTNGNYLDKCDIYLEPGFSTQSGSSFKAEIVP